MEQDKLTDLAEDYNFASTTIARDRIYAQIREGVSENITNWKQAVSKLKEFSYETLGANRRYVGYPIIAAELEVSYKILNEFLEQKAFENGDTVTITKAEYLALKESAKNLETLKGILKV